jgi:hypothetical protein
VISSIASSNLNYAIHQTPFSIYITIRKSLQKSQNQNIPDLQTSAHEHEVSAQQVICSHCPLLEETNSDLKNRYEDEILENEQQKKTILELNNIVDNLHSKLDNFETDLFEVNAMKTNLADELEEKVVECHELKVSNNMFPEKLQKAEADHFEYCNTEKEEKDTLSEKVEFLVSSIKRSTEETLSMEKKFDDGKKVIKKHKNEICLLKQELNILEQSNKKLEEQNYNLQSDQKLSEPNSSPLHGSLSKSCKTDFPASLEKIPTV